MKLFNLITMAALISFAVACGKDNSSGGSSGYKSSLSTGTASLSQSSRQAVDQFNRWYGSNWEPTTTAGVYRVGYASGNTTSSNNNCQLKDLGFLGLQYWYCSTSSSSNQSSSGLSECRASVFTSDQSVKGTNPTLAKIAAGQAGTLVNATISSSSSYQNATITLQFQKSNGHIATYTIDTRYHSAFQPVQLTDTENDSLMYLYGAAMAGSYNQYGQLVSVSGLPLCD